MLLIISISVFLGLNRPHDEEQIFGWSAIEGWLGIFTRQAFPSAFCGYAANVSYELSFSNLTLSLAACQAARHKKADDEANGGDVELDER